MTTRLIAFIFTPLAACSFMTEQGGYGLQVAPEPGVWTPSFEQVILNAAGDPCSCDDETPDCQALYIAQADAQPTQTTGGLWTVPMHFQKASGEAAQKSNTYVIYRMVIDHDSEEDGWMGCHDLAGSMDAGPRSLIEDVSNADEVEAHVHEYKTDTAKSLQSDELTKLDDGRRHAIQKGWWPKGDTVLPVDDVYIWNKGDMYAADEGTAVVIQIGTEGKDNPNYDPIWYQPDPVTFRKVKVTP